VEALDREDAKRHAETIAQVVKDRLS